MQKQVENARAMWLLANPDLDRIEQVYRKTVESFSNSKAGKKRPRPNDDESKEELEDWQRLATEQFCMILCQSGRAKEAKPWLLRLGYTCRLASCVLDYPTISDKDNNQKSPQISSTIPCHVWDHLLSLSELKHLQNVFADPKADYWTSHNYQVEPPSPYFSYVIPLQKHKPDDNTTMTASVDDKFGCLGTILVKLHSHLIQQFPKLSSASAVELWAHNRPHPTGHQFHFDSDNEGQGRMIKNPIMTAIVYLSSSSSGDGGGGPSVVTNQSLVSPHLATKAVISHASNPGRVVAFEGNLLHGVIPGKRVSSDDTTKTAGSHRRVTLMLAYWRRIRVRPSDQPGAARPFPFTTVPSDSQQNKWNELLVRPSQIEEEEEEDTSSRNSPTERDPIPLDHVYETLDGVAWTKAMGRPNYDQVYQGF